MENNGFSSMKAIDKGVEVIGEGINLVNQGVTPKVQKGVSGLKSAGIFLGGSLFGGVAGALGMNTVNKKTYSKQRVLLQYAAFLLKNVHVYGDNKGNLKFNVGPLNFTMSADDKQTQKKNDCNNSQQFDSDTIDDSDIDF